MKASSLPALLVSLLFIACHPPIDEVELENTLQSIIDDGMVAGFAVAVFNKDEVLYTNGYGYANLDSQLPYTPKTRQIIASISKTTIGMAIVKAEAMGLLSMDDPINNHLPFPVGNPSFPETPITIRQLATHTSSIAYSEQLSGDYAFSKNGLPLDTFVFNQLSPAGEWYREENFTANQPGTYFDYTNIGAAAAAFVVAQASGMSFDAFTRQHLFEPMGLPAVSWYDATVDDSASASLYGMEAPHAFEEIVREPVGIYPVRDLVASIEDLTRYAQGVLNKGMYDGHVVLAEVRLHPCLSPGLPIDVKGEAFSLDHGIFWIIDKNQFGVPAKVIGHSGGDAGIFSMLWFDPETELGYAMLSNTSQADANFGAYIDLWQGLYRYGKNFD